MKNAKQLILMILVVAALALASTAASNQGEKKHDPVITEEVIEEPLEIEEWMTKPFVIN